MASNPILITGGVICLFFASLLLVAGVFTNEGVKEMEDLEEIDYDASDYYFETMETETHHVDLAAAAAAGRGSGQRRRWRRPKCSRPAL